MSRVPRELYDWGQAFGRERGRQEVSEPPVVEAVCEFRLGRAVRWDLTVPGLLYERLKGEFPEREQRLIQEVEVASSPQVLQQTIRVHEAVLFFGPARRMFVQLDPHLLAIHVLQPYPTWLDFRPRIQGALIGLAEVLQGVSCSLNGSGFAMSTELRSRAPRGSVPSPSLLTALPVPGPRFSAVGARF